MVTAVAALKNPEGSAPSVGWGDSTPVVRSRVRTTRQGSLGLMRNTFVLYPPGAIFTAAPGASRYGFRARYRPSYMTRKTGSWLVQTNERPQSSMLRPCWP